MLLLSAGASLPGWSAVIGLVFQVPGRYGDGCMVYAIYIASILGAIALMLMLPANQASTSQYRAPNRGVAGKIGALLGCATLGGLWLALYPLLPADHGIPGGGWAMLYFYLFSSLGIFSAVKVITHAKPVYSALWFVMVVLSSAGIFLLLEAEFMAFAMVIIYGGAILVTYVFVIMLATQTPAEATQFELNKAAATAAESASSSDTASGSKFNLEPALACVSGFLLLAVLLSVHFQPMQPNRSEYARGWSDDKIAGQVLTQRPLQRLQEQHWNLATEPGMDSPLLTPTTNPTAVRNVERIGLDLFRSHPLGLELAGVILLVSLVGAVVIARMKVETEQESG